MDSSLTCASIEVVVKRVETLGGGVFGPKRSFAHSQFRILRFPLITVGNCIVGWLARHGWWCKQASTLVKNKPW
jgi:hypothetical protein